jgi:uncharacterized protein YciI
MRKVSGCIAALLLSVMAAGCARESGRTLAVHSDYIYLLHLAPRLHDPHAWTAADLQAVEDHFKRLEAAAAAGKVLVAGRSKEPDDQTFGIVVFEAANDADAKRFMETDPCLVHGVMTADLHPFAVALLAARHLAE